MGVEVVLVVEAAAVAEYIPAAVVVSHRVVLVVPAAAVRLLNCMLFK